jgi:hypothetical protein
MKLRNKIIIPACIIIITCLSLTYVALADTIFDKTPTSLPIPEEITIVKDALNELEQKNLELKDPDLEKWVLRKLVEAKTFDMNFTNDEIVKQAKESKNENEAFINYAIEHYGIEVTEEKLDKYIAEKIDIMDSKLINKQKIAEVLGMTTYELNHEFDRDLNTRLMVWEMVKPHVAKKHSISLSGQDYKEPVNINNLLLEKYNEEVQKFIGK